MKVKMKKLKDILKESVLGDLPSSRMFKYNKATGKYDAPNLVNEAPMDIELQEEISDAIILLADISKKTKSYSPKAFKIIQSTIKALIQAKKDIRN